MTSVTETFANLSPQKIMKGVTDMWSGGGGTRGKPMNPNLTSEIIKNAEDYADVIMLLEHEGLRREIRDMRKVIPHVSSATDWKVTVFLKWFRTYYAPYSKSHLEGEEGALFQQLSAQCAIPDKILQDHKTISQKLDQILELEEQYTMASSRQEKHIIVGRLVAMINDVTSTQEANFVEEEETLTPLIRRFMNQQSILKTIARSFNDAGLWQATIDLPPTMRSAKRWMTDTQYEDVENRIPWLQRQLLPLMVQQYESRGKGLLISLEGDSAPNMMCMNCY